MRLVVNYNKPTEEDFMNKKLLHDEEYRQKEIMMRKVEGIIKELMSIAKRRIYKIN